jgi:predicted  nucleic acid-binding Zn-ribbon protein
MAGKKQLRPVSPDERAAPATYSGASEHGSRLDELRALRRVLAAHIDSDQTLARDLAPLMRQAREISKEIEQLAASEAERARDAEVGRGSVSTAWRPEAI